MGYNMLSGRLQNIHKVNIIYSQCPSVILDIEYKLNEGCLARWITDNQKVSMESKTDKSMSSINIYHITKRLDYIMFSGRYKQKKNSS